MTAHNPNGILIGSSVFEGQITVTDRQTDRQTFRPTDHVTRSVTVGRISAYVVLSNNNSND